MSSSEPNLPFEKAPTYSQYQQLCLEADLRIKQEALDDFTSRCLKPEQYHEYRTKLFLEFNKVISRAINVLDSQDKLTQWSRNTKMSLDHPNMPTFQIYHCFSENIDECYGSFYVCPIKEQVSIKNDKVFMSIVDEILEYNPEYEINFIGPTSIMFKFKDQVPSKTTAINKFDKAVEHFDKVSKETSKQLDNDMKIIKDLAESHKPKETLEKPKKSRWFF